jgi:hypothetical protein
VHHTRDFQHCKNVAGTAGVPREPHHTAGKRHLGVDWQVRIGRWLPVRAAILTAIDRNRRAACKQQLRIGVIVQE